MFKSVRNANNKKKKCQQYSFLIEKKKIPANLV